MNDREVQKALGAQVLGLEPLPRLIGGGLLVGAGLVLIVSSSLRGLLATFPFALLLFGAAIALQAFGDHRRRSRLAAQLARAKAEMPQLREALRERRGGANPTQILQQRGYSEFFVRRWILKQLDDTA